MGLLNQQEQEYYDGNNFGNYQFTSLENIINQFIIAYVGEGKIISKIKKSDVAFHAHRALQELSFDTFKSFKAQEITVPASLQMILPQDYVNYTKISCVDSAGIKHLLYPTSKTSNPRNPFQNNDGDFSLTAKGTFTASTKIVVLDGEYSNILVGMTVAAQGINRVNYLDATVTDTTTANNITTITTDTNAQYASTETLVFTNDDNSLISQEESSVILLGASWSTLSKRITAASASDAASVEVGMLVSDELFNTSTTVTDVDGVIITTSNNSTAAGTDTSLTFISPNSSSDTWSSYKSGTPSENQDDYQDDTYWPMEGSRFGLDPQHAQANGSFYIDDQSGKIHFSSNISGKTVILDYISDSLGTDGEMQVHKFAEEAMYKSIAYAILSTRANVQEYIVQRYRKERFAAIRTAKLRLSNLKLEELTQILRGKSKQIKH